MPQIREILIFASLCLPPLAQASDSNPFYFVEVDPKEQISGLISTVAHFLPGKNVSNIGCIVYTFYNRCAMYLKLHINSYRLYTSGVDFTSGELKAGEKG